MYVKLFTSMLDSTIWCESPATKIAWITMLAKANQNGVVEASVPGLARAAGISIDECEVALEKFLSPDEYSRSQESEGRRIEKVDGGWLLLNYQKYREMVDRSDQRDKTRARVRKHREKKKGHGAGVGDEPSSGNEHVTESNASRSASASPSASALDSKVEEGGGSDAPRREPTASDRSRLERWVEREGKLTREDGPPPRHDPMHERIPFSDWFPSPRMLTWTRDLGLTDRNFDEMMAQARENITGKHDVEWLDGKIVRYVKTAIAQQNGKAAGGKRGHRQPSRGDVDAHEFDAPKGER